MPKRGKTGPLKAIFGLTQVNLGKFNALNHLYSNTLYFFLLWQLTSPLHYRPLDTSPPCIPILPVLRLSDDGPPS